MSAHPLQRLLGAGRAAVQALRRRLLAATRPAAAPLLTGTVADLARTEPELLAVLFTHFVTPVCFLTS